MNRNELRAQMARHGDSNQTLAKALTMSPTAFSNKINGKQPFRQNEIQGIIDRYNLEAEDIQKIFFAL